MGLLNVYAPFMKFESRLIALAVALGGVAALLEGAALTSLLPVLTPESNGGNWVSKWFELGSSKQSIIAALIIFVVLAALSAGVRYATDAVILHVKTEIEKKARRDMTDALLGMSWTRYMHLNQGDISKALVMEGLQIGAGIQQLISGLSAGLSAMCYLIVALWISLPMASMAASFAVVIYGIHRFAYSRTSGSASELSQLSSQIGDASASIFGNLKYFKSTGFEEVARTRARFVFDRFAHAYYDANIQPYKSRAVIEILGATFIVLFLTVQLFLFKGSAIEALLSLAIFYRMAPRLMTLQNSMLQAFSVVSWAVTYCNRLTMAMDSQDTYGGSTNRKVELSREIKLQSVEFSYTSDSKTIDGVNISIPRGAHIALVGHSGSGKSTLVDLITGLLTPTKGHIFVDGVDLSMCDRLAWRRRIGIVMQDTMLLNDTVAKNVAFGEEVINEERVVDCLQLANAWEFVSQFEGGIYEPVAERGARLSGGQRQRLAIARALYHKPDLLILDEATSALDSASEREFQAAIEMLEGRLTILSIAHRLNTIRRAQCIYVLRSGLVSEFGDWNQLNLLRGEFYQLLSVQGEM